jgi:aminopeptidase N
MKRILYYLFIQLSFTNCIMANNIDTKHISINLRFDWQKKQAFGDAEITLSPTMASDTIRLDAGRLNIHAVLLNGRTLDYNYDGGEINPLEIMLDRVYQPNETLILKIEYNTTYENKADPNAIWGSFGKGLRFQEPTSTTPNKRKQIWSSGEPENNKYWFPCNEDIADIHTTEIRATVENPMLVISNGQLVETIDNKDNTRTFHYKSEIPFPNYLVAIVAGEYVDVLQISKGVAIHNFGYPHEKEAVKATTELLPDMMRFIEEKTGFNYPLSDYTQVVVQDYPFPGLTGQHSASILSDNYIDDQSVHHDFKYLWDGVAMQALANQWFGNIIMPKSWSDIWLNNAFAQYFAGLYTAKNNTLSEYLLYILPFEISNVFADWNVGNIRPIVTNNYEDLTNFTSDSYSKYRGALVLRMLQKEVGDLNWWKAIQLYVKSNAGKQITTGDFQKAIEKITGESYQWFFDQWIYKTGMPKFEVTKNYDPSIKQLNITVRQTQIEDRNSKYEQVGLFKGKLEVEIDNNILEVYIEAKSENVFNFSMPKAPAFVNFNYEDTWICETEFAKNTDEYLQQLDCSKDILAKQKALDKLVEIANDSSTNTILKGEILAAFKKEITSNFYWRYRQYALGSLLKILTMPYDTETLSMILNLINTEKSWLKTSAIFTLGNTCDVQYFEIYKAALSDESDRVVNAAAIAMGKTKSPKAFDILMGLDNKPSWKNQSRISTLNGLEQLGDVQVIDYVLKCLSDNQSPRWYLATPVWDYPYAAAYTLATLGKADLGFPLLLERFKKSLEENDLNDIFQNVQLIDILKDERAKEVYQLLKEKFNNDAHLLETIQNYEANFLESIKE